MKHISLWSKPTKSQYYETSKDYKKKEQLIVTPSFQCITTTLLVRIN